ncbi:MAG: GntR family transcriptional regulator [Terriglobia bacterium]
MPSLSIMLTVAAPRLVAVKNGPVRPRVVDAIREAIFSGKFGPGETLRELHLARNLNVSQATVREALLQLEHTGLVVRTPNIGTTVTRLSGEEVRERLAMRVLLEGLAATEAAPKMTAEDFFELGRLAEWIAQAVSGNDYFELVQADLGFHRYIWKKSGNKTLYRTLDQLTAPLFAYVSVLRSSAHEQLLVVIQSHEPLVFALRGRDRQQIRLAVRKHIETAYTLFPNSGEADFKALAESLR